MLLAAVCQQCEKIETLGKTIAARIPVASTLTGLIAAGGASVDSAYDHDEVAKGRKTTPQPTARYNESGNPKRHDLPGMKGTV